MQLRYLIKTPLRGLGYDIVKLHRTTSAAQRRQQMLARQRVDLVLDVGADVGTYARELRRNGYAGRIISVEPRAGAFEKLQANIAGDRQWEARQLALGRERGTATIHISRNTYSSSLLPILPAHLAAEPEAEYIRNEIVQVSTVDALLEECGRGSQRIFLKIDTQGFERAVLEGAKASATKICGLQMELSLQPLYEGETVFSEMLGLLETMGYRLDLVDPGIHDPATGKTLQIDATFFRPM